MGVCVVMGCEPVGGGLRVQPWGLSAPGVRALRRNAKKSAGGKDIMGLGSESCVDARAMLTLKVLRFT